MKRLAITLLISFNLSANAYAQSVTCKNGVDEYSPGATICECPSLKVDGRMAGRGRTQITSRRLMCEQSGQWKSTDSLCLDIGSRGGVAADDYSKYYNLYCPRIAMESEQSYGPSILSLTAMSRICRAVPALLGPCKALIFAIAVVVQ